MSQETVAHLKQRLAEMESAVKSLVQKKNEIESELQEAQTYMAALRHVLDKERQGVQVPLSLREEAGLDQPSKFAGLNIRQALELMLKENPSISFKEARNALEHAHFDFKGKKPGNAVNMALVAIRARRKKTEAGESKSSGAETETANAANTASP